MVVAIHQPHFLPWLGYLERMARCDLFILLDHVQFERQNYQNRVRIKGSGGAQWITVPVFNRSRADLIHEKLIDNQRDGRLRWGRKVALTLGYAYKGAPFYSSYAPALQALLDRRWDRLVDLNLAGLELLRGALGIRTPMVRSSELKVDGQKSGLVLALCKAVGADTFLGGLGGSREYLDQAAFDREGVRVVWQSFRHPRYRQHPFPESFVDGLSAVDLLFNCGPESPRLLLGQEPVTEAEHG